MLFIAQGFDHYCLQLIGNETKQIRIKLLGTFCFERMDIVIVNNNSYLLIFPFILCNHWITCTYCLQ